MPDDLPTGLSVLDLNDDLHFCIMEDDEAEIEKGEAKQEVDNDDMAIKVQEENE